LERPMPKHSDRTSKRQFLRQQGALNPRPQDVAHELFRNQELISLV